MRVVRHDGPGVARLAFHGELDLATTDLLGHHVAAVLDALPAEPPTSEKPAEPPTSEKPARTPADGKPDKTLGSPALRRLVVDVAGLTFCDSAGIDALLNARAGALARGVGFQVAGARGIVRRSMAATGVLTLLTAA